MVVIIVVWVTIVITEVVIKVVWVTVVVITVVWATVVIAVVVITVVWVTLVIAVVVAVVVITVVWATVVVAALEWWQSSQYFALPNTRPVAQFPHRTLIHKLSSSYTEIWRQSIFPNHRR